MRRDLDHLPEGKRAELGRVLQILFDGFEAAKAGRSHAHLKNGRILKVILFGSYARGDWVADPVGGYYSDYDLLVVVDHEALTDVVEYWAAADDQLMRERLVAKRLSAPVNFIVHSLADVNAQLRKGRPFFLDVLRDGIALYEAEGFEFVKPEPLTPQAALEEAEGYFTEWFGSAEQRLEIAGFAISRGFLKDAAFDLHQTAERLYVCLLLVATLYAPKSHRLSFLRSQAERLAPDLIEAWPRATRFEQRCFEQLRRAYVEARYSPSYQITSAELDWLLARVEVLRGLVEVACRRKLDDLRSVAG
ncbi:HEPN domain-containing protein [Phenylobacterium sp. LjRoot164]|uniref:HEPN domain-containing protein n=1 Tax=unclassified Phenylobacterium TaxID=2640670 RepID=UPI003ED08E29